MRIFTTVFFLIITISGISGKRGQQGESDKCRKPLPKNYDPQCGIDAKCNFHAANRGLLEMEICRRTEAHVPQFLSIRQGKCPAVRDRCPPTSLNYSK